MTKIYVWIVIVRELLDHSVLIAKLRAQEYLSLKYEEQEAEASKSAEVNLFELG